jgi:hypothetical protein
VPDTLTFALPEGMKNSFDSLLALAIATLEQAGESDLARWAGAVRQDVQDAPVQERLALDLSQVADSLDDGPLAHAGEWAGFSLPFARLMEEFAAFGQRPMTTQPQYDGVDHSLDLGEILLDSLDKLLDGHPVSRAMVSLIKEIVQMAKAAARTLK